MSQFYRWENRSERWSSQDHLARIWWFPDPPQSSLSLLITKLCSLSQYKCYIFSKLGFLFLKINLLILFYLFYLWLRWVFVAVHGLFSGCGERGLLFVAVHRLLIAVASRCRAWALDMRASVVVAHGLSSCGSRALECRLSSCGSRA